MQPVIYTRVELSPNPQSNGKLERFHGSIKTECIRRKALTSADHARSVIEQYIACYNHEWLHSAIGYVTPAYKLAGTAETFQTQRDLKLKAARVRRAERNQTRKTEDKHAD